MGDYPYPTDFLAPLPGRPVNLAYKMIARVSSKVEDLTEVTALVYNSTNGTLTCLDPDTEYIECADPTGSRQPCMGLSGIGLHILLVRSSNFSLQSIPGIKCLR